MREDLVPFLDTELRESEGLKFFLLLFTTQTELTEPQRHRAIMKSAHQTIKSLGTDSPCFLHLHSMLVILVILIVYRPFHEK